jgi:hypothetical protein
MTTMWHSNPTAWAKARGYRVVVIRREQEAPN